MNSKVYPAMTEEQLMKVAESIDNINKQQTQLEYLTRLVDQYTEELAWETNKLVDMKALLDNIIPKEGQKMPYMYCQHNGCNETVKLPAQYCAKHMVKPAVKTEDTVELMDIIEPKVKTKKTTK